MNEVYQQVITILISIWRRRWYVLAVGWVVCGAGWTAVAHLPDKYQANARIYVDMDTMLGPLMQGLAVQVNLFQQIDVMQRTLLSRPNIEKVVLMTDMDLKVHTDQEKEELLENLKNKIRIGQQGRNLFNVAFEDEDPNLAKRVVQAMLQIFVEGNVGASRKDMDTTRRFLDDQIREYERQLEEAEARLAQFKRKNMGFLPGEGNYYTHLQGIQARVKQDEAALQEIGALAEELRVQLQTVPQFLEMENSGQSMAQSLQGGEGPDSALQIKILDMTSLIEDLKTQYTDKHPDVVTATKRLERFQKELADQQKMSAEMNGEAKVAGPGESPQAVPGSKKNVIPNPVYEQVKLQLVQREAELVTLKLRAQSGRQELEKWEKMAAHVPQVEQELTRLNRDYTIIKTKYEEMRARQESARLARDMETKAQKVQFRIIDPPKVPIKPSSPNRPLFLAGVLALGVGAGLAFAFLLGQLNTTFASVSRLKSAFTLPVVGSITAITSNRERRRRVRELLSFCLVSTSLLIAFGGLILIELLGARGVLDTVKTLITI